MGTAETGSDFYLQEHLMMQEVQSCQCIVPQDLVKTYNKLAHVIILRHLGPGTRVWRLAVADDGCGSCLV